MTNNLLFGEEKFKIEGDTGYSYIYKRNTNSLHYITNPEKIYGKVLFAKGQYILVKRDITKTLIVFAIRRRFKSGCILVRKLPNKSGDTKKLINELYEEYIKENKLEISQQCIMSLFLIEIITMDYSPTSLLFTIMKESN